VNKQTTSACVALLSLLAGALSCLSTAPQYEEPGPGPTAIDAREAVADASATPPDGSVEPSDSRIGTDSVAATPPDGSVEPPDSRVGVDGGTVATLTVRFVGTGTGTVSAEGLPLNCSSTCTLPVPRGTSVNLLASPAAGSTIGGWSAPCTGAGRCLLKLDGDVDVSIRFDRPASLIWRTVSGDISAVAMSTDSIIVIGILRRVLVAGGTTFSPSGTSDIFLASYTLNGDLRWGKLLGGTGPDFGHGVAVDEAGNIYATGIFNSPEVDFGGRTLVKDPRFDGFFLAKYSASGELVWVLPKGGFNISRDSEGTFLVSGFHYTGRYRDDGEAVWEMPLHANDGIRRPDGSHAFVGVYFSVITLAGRTFVSSGESDFFIVDVDRNGLMRWAMSFGGAGYDYAQSIALSSDGNLFVGGDFQETMVMGGTSLRSVSGSDMFLAKLNGASGAPLWALSANEGERDYVVDLFPEDSGHVIAAGWGFPLTRYNGTTGAIITSSNIFLGLGGPQSLIRSPDGYLIVGTSTSVLKMTFP
jgi:hypothetical protein